MHLQQGLVNPVLPSENLEEAGARSWRTAKMLIDEAQMLAHQFTGLVADLGAVPLAIGKNSYEVLRTCGKKRGIGNPQHTLCDPDPRPDFSAGEATSEVGWLRGVSHPVDNERGEPAYLRSLKVVTPHEVLHPSDLSVVLKAERLRHLLLLLESQLILLFPGGEVEFISDPPEKILCGL